MCVVQCLGALERDLHDLVHRQQAVLLGERLESLAAVYVLHDYIAGLAFDARVENIDDVRMSQGAGGVGLVEEQLPVTCTGLRIGQQFRKSHLDGHGTIAIGIMAEVDDAHAATVDLANDLVFTQAFRNLVHYASSTG